LQQYVCYQLTRYAQLRQHHLRVADLSVISHEAPALVFVNPLAGAGRAGAYLLRVREVFDTQRIPAEFVLTESAADLESRARAAIADGQRLLLAMGGDGTFQGLANAAFGSGVLLGLLPAGGGNDFASALGLPKDPVAAARAVLRGKPRSVDLIRARMDGGRERLYAGGGGVGLDVDAVQHAAGIYRRLPGRLRYVASALRALRDFTPLHVRAEFPGSELPPIEAKVLLAAALNTPTYGAGLRLAPDAQIDDGWLDLAFVEDLRALQVLALLPRLLKSGNLPDSHVKRTRVRRARLSADRPCFFPGDGEILGPAPVEIEVLPGAVRVLGPAGP
jgi:diacylglycerol kinase (ATP)